ncbi:MAG: CBS domain-containing protein [Deltaproteobacteria bacterium]|nr:CBS domain-containing protein [Deltaproteobacteria bacterium]
MLSNKVSEIMTREMTTVEVSSTVFAAMEVMAAKNVGRAVITDNQVPVGIFTEHDVLKRVMNKKLEPKKTGIKRVMTSPIDTVQQEAHIVEALGKMYKSKFRHLLVRGEKGGIVGMISMRRILKLAAESGRGLRETQTIGSIMSADLITVDASQSIYETIELMIKKETNCILVLSAGEPKGIFTERDVLKRVAVKEIDTKKTPIAEVMTADFVTMPHSALVGEVLVEMYERGFRHIPVLGDSGALVGIVSMRDVLKYAEALDIDESVRRTWKEIAEFWDSEEEYTPG